MLKVETSSDSTISSLPATSPVTTVFPSTTLSSKNVSPTSLIPKIRMAPWNVPFRRRLQITTVFLWQFSLPATILFFLFLCTVPFFWPMIIPYLLYTLFDIAPEDGGRRYDFARKSAFWRWYAEYFPIKLVKTADLDPSKNYVFGYHPHGIISVGAWTNFATEANNFSKLFPGITCRMLTLTTNFQIPFYREYLMAQGLASVSRQSCDNILQRGPGHSTLIVVGGAVESLNAYPGTYDLVLKKRLGFIKVAVCNGACLVPVLSFGENDIWDQVINDRHGVIGKFQESIQKLSGWTLPLFHGRGFFNYDFGVLPYRHHIVTVVGKPIEVAKKVNPTVEDLKHVQKKYIDGLNDIWNDYKDVYAKDRKRELTLAA